MADEFVTRAVIDAGVLIAHLNREEGRYRTVAGPSGRRRRRPRRAVGADGDPGGGVTLVT